MLKHSILFGYPVIKINRIKKSTLLDGGFFNFYFASLVVYVQFIWYFLLIFVRIPPFSDESP